MIDDQIPPFPQMFNQWELDSYIDGEVKQPILKIKE